VKRLAVIGGGSWGTALTVVLAERFERVRLWVYEQDLAERMQSLRENDLFLPGAKFGPSVEVTSSLAYAVEEAEVVLGGLLLGIRRVTIVEFSFLLAVPTMVASAFVIFWPEVGDVMVLAGGVTSAKITRKVRLDCIINCTVLPLWAAPPCQLVDTTQLVAIRPLAAAEVML